MSDKIEIEHLIASVADWPGAAPLRASSRLKSRIYSQLTRKMACEGELMSLPKTKAAGRKLCVFEELIQIAPVGEAAKQRNWCRLCHARVAGEHIENAPIYWPHCPYVLFQNR